MNARIIFVAAIVFIGAIISAEAVGENFSISIASIPDDGNFDVRAQVFKDSNGQFRIFIDEDSVNDPQINRIVAHEIGHVNNWEGDEAFADDFANRVVNDGSEPIVDAFNGIH
jgi:hypothetical protein